jgi:hypothetical protein
MWLQGASISNENQIHETIPCNGKTMSKTMGREWSQIMIWDKNRVYQIERNKWKVACGIDQDLQALMHWNGEWNSMTWMELMAHVAYSHRQSSQIGGNCQLLRYVCDNVKMASLVLGYVFKYHMCYWLLSIYVRKHRNDLTRIRIASLSLEYVCRGCMSCITVDLMESFTPQILWRIDGMSSVLTYSWTSSSTWLRHDHSSHRQCH